MRQAHIYRLNDAVAVALPGTGETVYLTPRDAFLIAERMAAISKNIELVRFAKSSERALDLEVTPSETARNQTIARMPDGKVRLDHRPVEAERIVAARVAREIIEWDNIHHDIPDQIVSEAIRLLRGIMQGSDVLPEADFEASVRALENITEG